MEPDHGLGDEFHELRVPGLRQIRHDRLSATLTDAAVQPTRRAISPGLCSSR
jgi:hypothetical protein